MDDNLMQLLSQQMAGNGGNPDMSMLMMQMLQQINNKKENLAVNPERGSENFERQLRLAKKNIHVLKAQLNSASEFIISLADFIGACPVCFGLSKVKVGSHLEECPTCEGRYGGPGSRSPDPLLRSWIEPALRRMENTKSKIQTPSRKQGE